MSDPTMNAASPSTVEPPADPIAIDWLSLADLRLRYIQCAIQHMGGNKTRAAVLLGIDRRTLNRILARERARKAKKQA